MARTLTVSLTELDIATGARNSTATGPVALACARALGIKNESGWVNLGVSVGILYWLPRNAPRDVPFFDRWQHVELPAHVKEWELAFDRGEPVSPLSFEVQLP